MCIQPVGWSDRMFFLSGAAIGLPCLQEQYENIPKNLNLANSYTSEGGAERLYKGY